MIELFDAARLMPRRDRTWMVAGGLASLVALGLGAHVVMLHLELDALQATARSQQADLARLKATEPPPAPALLADLEARARSLESEVAQVAGGSGAMPSPSQWLERLDALSSNDVGLSRIEIDRAGSARIEGQARSPQAVSGYVQALEAQNASTPMRARTIEVRQDEKAAPLLRFQMRANLKGSAS